MFKLYTSRTECVEFTPSYPREIAIEAATSILVISDADNCVDGFILVMLFLRQFKKKPGGM